MRIVVLASQRRGFGAYCLPALLASPRIEVASVVYCEGVALRPWKKRWKKLEKIARIGPLGALNGRRMRAWYDLGDHLAIAPLDEIASRHEVPYGETPSMFSPRTVELCRAAGADLGLSLGNGYIPERVFAVPRLGMLNVHHELLPQFQGAQSVIWQLYHGSSRTGFTIHQIDRHIDTGAILHQEEIDILFGTTLEETVRRSYARLFERSRAALVRIVEEFETVRLGARAQGAGRSFTTPSYRQFRQIERMHDVLRRRTRAEK
ncbi:MAG TPA: formyltransferase family protein [Gemmatimonadaceae bacterium]|nr:formyltransferase family protein [Gemmatimonadaceae bacterium]